MENPYHNISYGKSLPKKLSYGKSPVKSAYGDPFQKFAGRFLRFLQVPTANEGELLAGSYNSPSPIAEKLQEKMPEWAQQIRNLSGNLFGAFLENLFKIKI